jgi:hypothetical protein
MGLFSVVAKTTISNELKTLLEGDSLCSFILHYLILKVIIENENELFADSKNPKLTVSFYMPNKKLALDILSGISYSYVH